MRTILDALLAIVGLFCLPFILLAVVSWAAADMLEEAVFGKDSK